MPKVNPESLKNFGIIGSGKGLINIAGRSEVCTVIDIVRKSNVDYVMCITDDGRVLQLLAPRNVDIAESYIAIRSEDRVPKIRVELAGTRITSYDVIETKEIIDFLMWFADMVDKGKVKAPPGMRIYNINRTKARLSTKGIILALADGTTSRDLLASNSSINVQISRATLSEQGVDEFILSGVVITVRETYMGTVREMIRAFVPMGIESIRKAERQIVNVDYVSATEERRGEETVATPSADERLRMAEEIAKSMERHAATVATTTVTEAEEKHEETTSGEAPSVEEKRTESVESESAEHEEADDEAKLTEEVYSY